MEFGCQENFWSDNDTLTNKTHIEELKIILTGCKTLNHGWRKLTFFSGCKDSGGSSKKPL